MATALAALVAGIWTFLDPGLLHGPKAMQGSARGTALVLTVVAVPLLLVSLRLASRRPGARSGARSTARSTARSSARSGARLSARSSARSGAWALVTAGALLYVLYNAVLLLFLTPFNGAFLVYVALLGSALWALGYLAAVPALWATAARVAQRAPVRAISLYVWVVSGLNALLWLLTVIPSLRPYPTPMLEGTGLQTNAIYVQDLAIWLPLAGVAALWLRRRQARGVMVVGPVLGLWVVEAVSIAVDQAFGVHADPTSPVVSMTLVGPFLALAVVGVLPLWLLLRGSAHDPS